MVKSINLVKRLNKDKTKEYVCVEFDLGYKKHCVFLQMTDILELFDLKTSELYAMKVGDVKPLVITR